jgi:hypothetical protein
MQVDYYAKYLKYKQKYLDLKEEMMGSGGPAIGKPEETHLTVAQMRALAQNVPKDKIKVANLCLINKGAPPIKPNGMYDTPLSLNAAACLGGGPAIGPAEPIWQKV